MQVHHDLNHDLNHHDLNHDLNQGDLTARGMLIAEDQIASMAKGELGTRGEGHHLRPSLVTVANS